MVLMLNCRHQLNMGVTFEAVQQLQCMALDARSPRARDSYDRAVARQGKTGRDIIASYIPLIPPPFFIFLLNRTKNDLSVVLVLRSILYLTHTTPKSVSSLLLTSFEVPSQCTAWFLYNPELVDDSLRPSYLVSSPWLQYLYI